MRQFFIRGDEVAGDTAHISDPAALHHLRDVLRMRQGEEIILADAQGRQWRAALQGEDSAGMQMSLLEALRAQMPSLGLVLALALVKGGAFEEALDMGTQLGATAFQPLATERTQVRLAPEDYAAKCERWRRIVREAAQQCNRPDLPEVRPPLRFDPSLGSWQGQQVLIAWERGGQSLEETLDRGLPGQGWVVLVGPEGGFSPEEAARACQAGAQPVTLGPRILRTPVACASITARIIAHSLRRMP